MQIRVLICFIFSTFGSHVQKLDDVEVSKTRKNPHIQDDTFKTSFYYKLNFYYKASMLLFCPLQRLQLRVLAKRYECITAVLWASFGFQLVVELISAFEFLLLGPCRICELQISRKPWNSSTPRVIWNSPHGCSREAASTFYAPTTYQIISGAPTFKKNIPV